MASYWSLIFTIGVFHEKDWTNTLTSVHSFFELKTSICKESFLISIKYELLANEILFCSFKEYLLDYNVQTEQILNK